jgi:hypothetical protein
LTLDNTCLTCHNSYIIIKRERKIWQIT